MVEKNKTARVAKNTVMLYTRQIVIMIVSLYTVRIILSTLGEVDYGLYTVVAGIVTMFSIFSGAMASASQRFFSFYIGKEDYDGLKKIFSLSKSIYMIINLAAVIIMETIGLWYVMNRLFIPDGREPAAVWVYEMAIISLICMFLTTPYMSLLIAYENMNAYAFISIVEAGLKLGVALAVQAVTADKLITYAVLTAMSTFLVTFLYKTYCRQRYAESKSGFYWDRELFTQIFSFTGWNMFGSAVGTFKIQAVNVILNQYFSQAVVTSRGIASSVNSAVVSFSQSFGTALRPLIVKEYAAGNKENLHALVSSASKATFLLMYIFILPLGMEMNYVLFLWLGTVPDKAVVFTTLTIMDALIDSISYPLMSAALASGNIKLYQTVVGGIQLLNLPAAWLAVSMGAPAWSVFAAAIILTVVSFAARLIILSGLMDFSALDFIKNTVFPILAAVCITIWPPFCITHLMEESFLRVILTTVVSIICSAAVFWFAAANKKERAFIINFIKKRGILK